MWTKLAVIASLSSIAFSAQAATDTAVTKSIELKDGAVVHVFADGKMGMENRFGRAVSMAEGQVMQARDGGTIKMQGNEVWRVKKLQPTVYGA